MLVGGALWGEGEVDSLRRIISRTGFSYRYMDGMERVERLEIWGEDMP
jgi:hypothetical protein